MYHQSRERPIRNGHASSQSAVITIISSATLTTIITTRPARIMRFSLSCRQVRWILRELRAPLAPTQHLDDEHSRHPGGRHTHCSGDCHYTLLERLA